MSNTVELVCFAFEILCDYFLLSSISGLNRKDMKHPFFALILYYCFGEFLNRLFPNILGWLLLFICFYLCLKFITDNSWIETLYLTMFINIPIFFIQKIIIIIFSRLGLHNANQIALYGSIATVLIIAILCWYIPFKRLYSLFISRGILSKFLVIHLFILYMTELAISKYTTLSTLQTLPFLTVFAILVIITDIVLLKQQGIIERQKHNLDNYLTYQPMMYELIQDIRSKQHNFDNQLASIKMLPFTHTNYDSLKNALVNYSEHISQEFNESQLLKINLTIVAGFIFSKIVQAKTCNKSINIIIRNYHLESHMPEYELIQIIGIMIDNSLEAISANETISLCLEALEDRIAITTTNSGPIITPYFQTNMFKPGFTTKNTEARSRGFGLYSLKKMVDQYNGKIYISNSELSGSTYINFEVIV